MPDGVHGGFLKASHNGPLVVQGPGGLPLSAAPAPLTTETPARVASSATVVTLLAANTLRRSASIYNESTAILYVKHGAAASITDYKLQIPAGGYYELPSPLYTGVITGLWSLVNGAAQVSEGV